MRPHDAAELSRMASEKVAAAALGMVEGQKEIVRLCTAAMAGRLRYVDGSTVIQASLAPALLTVKRNASRLRRRKAYRGRAKAKARLM